MIYMDNAATTRTDPRGAREMEPYFSEEFGNPSAIYQPAVRNKQAINVARRQIASSLGAKESEIYFTSCGTESDNSVLVACVDAFTARQKNSGNTRKPHIITSAIEHPAILRTCEYLQKIREVNVTYIKPDEKGFIDPAQVEEAITADTVLISIMFANNETGTIEPVKEIGQVAKKHGIFFHTDAVQAFGHIPIDVNEMNIDLLSASGHKFGGPKGIGFLYMRRSVRLNSFLHGGEQERGHRAGTENVPGIVGMGKAASIAISEMEENSAYVSKLRDYMSDRLLREIPLARINGDRKLRLPNNVNVTFPFADGQQLLMKLDAAGICASSGSACAAGSVEPSHVLIALGVPYEEAFNTVRFTLSRENTKEEVDTVVDFLKETVASLRENSPGYMP